jgi:hypothetical protein
MNLLVYLVMFVWIPVVLYLCYRLPVQRALVVCFIGAWLFLPQVAFKVPGLPDITKMSVTCYGILLATLLFDAGRFKAFRPRWVDVPMVVWCLCPIVSSLTNGLGPYDGFATALDQTVTWGFPYFLGRLYLGNFSGLHQLAWGILVGGLVYVPLCLLEVRLSPQLHNWVYGFHAHSFAQTIRYGGFRPTVFMQHGLMVGMWMMSATLIAIWLWKTGTLKVLWNVPIWCLVLVLVVTFVLVKSTGAYALLLLGVLLLLLLTWLRTSVPLLLIIVAMIGYLWLGTTGSLSAQQTHQLITLTTQVTDLDRAQSLAFRLEHEQLLSAKARQKALFGWGGWGRARITDPYGRDLSVTDSLWIITFGNLGIMGLISVMGVLLLPIVSLLWFRYPVATWSHAAVAPVAVLSVILLLYTIDCLFNAHVNPVFTLVAGGLSGLVVQERQTQRGTMGRVLRRRSHSPSQSPSRQRQVSP